MTELFNIPETLSPRLQWLKKYQVHTRHSICRPAYGGPWTAWSGDYSEALSEGEICNGETEMDAIADVAEMHGWLLWNEEGAAKCL